MTRLERRILLAADLGGAAITGTADVTIGDTAQHAEMPELAQTNAREIVFVDAGVEDIGELSWRKNADVVLLVPGVDPIQQISRALATRQGIQAVHIVSHGTAGELQLADQRIGTDQLLACHDQLRSWSSSLTPEADLLLYACQAGAGAAGREFLATLATLTGCDVAASNDLTGATGSGGDWLLEQHHGPIESSLAITVDARQKYRHTLDIVVNAWGQTGEEEFNLQIDGSIVANWTADVAWQPYVYATNDFIDPSRVRVAFTNDQWDPNTGFDRNLFVDNVDINGTAIRPDDSMVFSTGTWRPEDGVTEGFGRGIVLHANGYFEFGTPNNQGSTLAINAAGQTGQESMQLFIEGTPVATYTNVPTSGNTYTYDASTVLSPSQIQLHFINDLYEPANGIDRNLIVDNIVLDGTTYETEDPTVFSTATWLPGDQITPGFGRGSTLHSNGYFEYGDIGGAQFVRLENSVYNVGEGDGSVTLTALRTGGTSGTVTVDYATVPLSAASNIDYGARSGTFTFLSGETSKSVIVPIVNDGEVETNEQFAFTIENIQGNADLSAPRTATITIDDNDSILAQGDGLLGEYFNNRDFTSPFINRVDSSVDFQWQLAAPAAGMGAETFSVRWTGQIEPRFNETYTFHTTTDDGVRLWVNDQLIIDQFVDQAATEHTGTITLQAGQFYDIRFDYYDNLQSAVARLEWSSASQTREVVPQSALYAADPPEPTPGDNLERQVILSGLSRPTAVKFSPDGRNMYVAEQGGVVTVVREGIPQSTPFLDISAQVNGVRDRGLLDIAIHPDFENNPYIYLLFTYDPPEVFQYSAGTLQGPDGIGNRAGRLIRVTADSNTDYTTAVPGSEVVLLGTNSTWNNFNGFVNSTVDFNEPPAGILSNGTNLRDFIASDSESHTVGGLAFGLDGNLFVSIGDGTSYNSVDPRTVRVQDIDNLSGKILRIDPITGQGLADNPFYNNDPDANRSKVYQYGLRNPFRITVDSSTGQLYVGDVGWTQWEEINAASPGANFGWPYYEGGSGVNLRTSGYQNLPEAQAFYNSGQTATPGILALNHAADGINAIVVGAVYRGTAYPSSYQGDVFFNDLGQGILRNVSFDASGNITNIETFSTGNSVVVQVTLGPDGNLYYVDLDDGQIGRWVFV